MVRGLNLLCEDNNARKALENIAKAKEEARCKGENRGQFYRLLKYEAIVKYICSVENKLNLTFEEIAEATKVPVRYVRNNINLISLYVLAPNQVDKLSSKKERGVGKKSSEHTIPVCPYPFKRARRFFTEI